MADYTRYDEETGFWYYRNRMYSDVLGRFLQRDPLGYVDGVNMYAYVTNNPIAFVDPMGTVKRYVTGDPSIAKEINDFLPSDVQGPRNAFQTRLDDSGVSLDEFLTVGEGLKALMSNEPSACMMGDFSIFNTQNGRNNKRHLVRELTPWERRFGSFIKTMIEPGLMSVDMIAGLSGVETRGSSLGQFVKDAQDADMSETEIRELISKEIVLNILTLGGKASFDAGKAWETARIRGDSQSMAEIEGAAFAGLTLTALSKAKMMNAQFKLLSYN